MPNSVEQRAGGNSPDRLQPKRASEVSIGTLPAVKGKGAKHRQMFSGAQEPRHHVSIMALTTVGTRGAGIQDDIKSDTHFVMIYIIPAAKYTLR